MRPVLPQRGFTYLLVLLFVALAASGLAALGDVWVTTRQRDREAELLFAGDAFRQAIAYYYEGTPGTLKQFPATLEQLMKDPRFPDTRHHLRKLYTDPMTGTTDWVLIKAPAGGIMGVASASDRPPMKRSDFRGANRVFQDQAARLKEKLRYRDWEFVYDPALRQLGTQGALR